DSARGSSRVSSFFFQAEDGIRARNVTGVQTCALPIYELPPLPAGAGRRRGDVGDDLLDGRAHRLQGPGGRIPGSAGTDRGAGGEIGRASCRERAEGWGGGVRWEKGKDKEAATRGGRDG